MDIHIISCQIEDPVYRFINSSKKYNAKSLHKVNIAKE